MTVQIITYSKSTGRVRGVYDPQVAVASALQLLNQVPLHSGEGSIVYTKLGGGLDDISAWQAAVDKVTGLNPAAAQSDWLCGIDENNVIQTWLIGDILCGDSVLNLTLVPAPWGADSTWSYNGQTFTAPVPVTKAA